MATRAKKRPAKSSSRWKALSKSPPNKASSRRHLRWRTPHEGRCRCKCTDDELIVTLVDGRRVSAPLAWFPRLLRATPKQRANWRLIGRGIGIHWEDVDEDISVRSLLAS